MPLHPMVVDYVSGVCGGVSVVLIGHPFDTIKTRMQVSPRGTYKGTLDCIRKTHRREGFGGFYLGITSPLLGQMFFRAASYMTFHSSYKHLKTSSLPGNAPLFAAGGLTGIIISFIETPIDLVKTKLQIQIFSSKLSSGGTTPLPPPYNSFASCVSHIIKSHGMRGLFQGFSATAIRNVPANALFFPVNEICKQVFVDRRNRDRYSRADPNSSYSTAPLVTAKDLSLGERLASGASAGMCYWVLTYPLDAIKGRMQGAQFEQRRGWLATARLIYEEHGLKGFRRGIVPCAARSLPACAALFTTMDLVRQQLCE